MRNILLIRFSSLGDVILTSATVLNIKINFPDSHVVYLTKETYGPIVEGFDGVDEIVTAAPSVTAAEYARLLLKLRKREFDAVIDLHGNWRAWLARNFVTARTKCVYPKRRLERVRLVRQHRIPKSWPHTIDLYNQCIERLGGRIVCKRAVIRRLNTSGIPEDVAELMSGRPTVVIAPGAAHPNKQWPIDRFVDVAKRLHQSNGAVIIWAVTAVDATRASLTHVIPQEYFAELVDCPVGVLASIIALADVTLANDSGIAHLSSAVGTPVVAVFGPTHPALGFAPRGVFDRVVEVEEPCRPCSLHGRKPCYREERFCFNRIGSETVGEAVADKLEMSRKSGRALFVDRDGTIIKDKVFLADADGIEFEPRAIEALRRAQGLGFKIVVLSNQSGVARGLFGIETVERINERFGSLLSAQGVQVDGIYYCPHLPGGSVPEYAKSCDCRKPAAGMVEQAARRLEIKLHRSYVVGDKIDDVNLGRVIGGYSFLVRSGKGKEQEQQLRESGISHRVEVCDDLGSAVKRIEALEQS
ncbi:MAG TPA: HAD-IIIA family hydrolase [Candidatus Deferrimicrobium sp.]|nr:HAD-IIIA family hydrolase [Candidatus Deferrimicrobium sp.]